MSIEKDAQAVTPLGIVGDLFEFSKRNAHQIPGGKTGGERARERDRYRGIS